MAFNLPTEEEARAILADQMEAQARRMHDIDYRTPGPLQQAAGAGDVELVRDLLAAGEDPNKLDETDHCAIRLAMAMIHIKRRPEDADTVRRVFACIELCLDAGADPIGRVVCPQVRRLIDMYRERHPDREDDPRLQRLSDSLAALEVSVGLDPGVETNPIEADLSDSEGTSGSEG